LSTKTRVAILGSGNIGTDILYKLRRSEILEPAAMIGVEADSDGLRRARELGLWTTHGGLAAFLADPVATDIPIVFDATSAYAHRAHAPVLQAAGKTCIDMTPAALGPYVVPPVNLDVHGGTPDINLVSCGGQATIPIVAAINAVSPVEYAEIVATIASQSAGPGTRQNIDEFTQTTARGLEVVGGARKGKAIIVLNPADPPIMMRNTVHAIVENVDEAALTQAVEAMVARVQRYVPGYTLKAQPLFEGNRVTVLLEVTGAGDYLPTYAGNLDIMTATAVKVGEDLARRSAANQRAAR
jgi:acetaldehyde dehydrogenase (acetylating)